jgi:hypothetical protein
MKIKMPRIHAFYIVSIAFCLFALTACSTSPRGTMPTYVHIDSFSFNLQGKDYADFYKAYGSPSHNINTVWAYYRNNDAGVNTPVGVFDLPVTFPVLTSPGHGSLELVPGIAVNGLNNYEEQYPFYAFDTALSLTAQPGKTINYTPTTTYTTATKAKLIADFQFGDELHEDYGTVGPTIIYSGSAGDSLLVDGTNIGAVFFNNSGDSTVDSTTDFFIDSTQAFIEFDYKSTVPFYVGLQGVLGAVGGSTTPTYLAGIYPSEAWKKFYLEVDNFVGYTKATTYRFYVKAALPAGQSDGKLLLAHIKLITF